HQYDIAVLQRHGFLHLDERGLQIAAVQQPPLAILIKEGGLKPACNSKIVLIEVLAVHVHLAVLCGCKRQYFGCFLRPSYPFEEHGWRELRLMWLTEWVYGSFG